ncbi:MAG: glycosyltransferase [Planctomycetes bacterium]|nr:glycosyltransferase [Planctomycetota bacterium]
MNSTPPDRAGPQLSLAIPCYNEQDSIGETAPALARAFREAGIELELILVDNGSTDRTGEILDELIRTGLPAHKVAIPVNRGYSAGIVRGLEACTAPIIGFVHADGQVSPEDTVMVYRLLENREERVLAKVRRRFRRDSWRRKIVSIAYNGLMQVLFGWLGAIDINGSPKMFSKRNFERMQLDSQDWFLDPEIVLKAKWLGLRTIEIDVEGRSRHGGTSHVRAGTVLEFVRNILRYRFGSRLRRWHRSLRSAEASGGSCEVSATPATGRRAAGLGGVRIVEQCRFDDARGSLHKVLSAAQTATGLPRGEVYVTTAKPGEAKGNHYHARMGEWFAVVQGEGAVVVCDPATGERQRIELGSSTPRSVYVPPGLAHAIVNDGDDVLVCVACAEAEHDPDDVFPFPVVGTGTARQADADDEQKT